jgi:integrase
MTTPPDPITVTIAGHPLTVTIHPAGGNRPNLILDCYLPSGRRWRSSTGTTDYDLARQALDAYVSSPHGLAAVLAEDIQALAARSGGDLEADTDDPTIRHLVRWYLDTYLPDQERAPRTVAKYSQVLEDLLTYCRSHHIGRAQQLSYTQLLRFTEWLGTVHREKATHAPKTRNDAKAIIRSMMLAAVRAGELQRSPIQHWEIRKSGTDDTTQTALTPAECARLLAVIDAEAPHIAPVVRFCLWSGQGIADVLGLRWSQVHGDRVRRARTKTGKLAVYGLSTDAQALLAALRQANTGPYVFTNTAGQRHAYNAVQKAFSRALARAGYSVTRDGQEIVPTLHTLRHTYATHMAHLGCPPMVLMSQLGHKRIETTLRYYHSDPDQVTAWAQKYGDWISQSTTENVSQPSQRAK